VDINRADGALSAVPYRLIVDGVVLFVRLTPKGGRDAVEGVMLDGDGKAWVKARVSSVPEDGKANAALEALLAKTFGVSRGNVSVVAGQTARNKQVAITGDQESLLKSMTALISTP
jgi:uncharacterized protein